MNLTAAAGLRLRKEATNGREEPRYLRQLGDPLVAGARGSGGAPHETRGARRPEHVLAGHHSARAAAAHCGRGCAVGRRQLLLRERPWDAQEPEPCEESELRLLGNP